MLAFPANHPEYLYINTGIDSQLRTQSGGGQVAIGTTMPNSRFEIWTGASTAPLMHFRGNGNVALGLNALNTATGLAVTTLHSYNTAVGYAAGSGMTTGSNNIFLGTDTRTLTGNISNTLNIGNTLFANNLPNTYTGSAGYVGIGTRTPNQQLELTESMRLPTTRSATTGVIYKDGNRFMHNYVNG